MPRPHRADSLGWRKSDNVHQLIAAINNINHATHYSIEKTIQYNSSSNLLALGRVLRNALGSTLSRCRPVALFAVALSPRENYPTTVDPKANRP